jgi:hypothetical protein
MPLVELVFGEAKAWLAAVEQPERLLFSLGC